jgi:hypothetical protein
MTQPKTCLLVQSNARAENLQRQFPHLLVRSYMAPKSGYRFKRLVVLYTPDDVLNGQALRDYIWKTWALGLIPGVEPEYVHDFL